MKKKINKHKHKMLNLVNKAYNIIWLICVVAWIYTIFKSVQAIFHTGLLATIPLTLLMLVPYTICFIFAVALIAMMVLTIGKVIQIVREALHDK